MKKLIVTSMLLGAVFSFNAIAAVDCEGLSKVKKATYKARGFSELGKELASKSSEYSRCLQFNRNYPNVSWNYVDKITGVIRKQNEQWNGEKKYGEKRKYSNTSNSENKSRGETIADMGGSSIYPFIVKRGVEEGLDVIKTVFKKRGHPERDLIAVEEYIKSLSWNEIKAKARKFRK